MMEVSLTNDGPITLQYDSRGEGGEGGESKDNKGEGEESKGIDEFWKRFGELQYCIYFT
jgi:hypothetical protein